MGDESLVFAPTLAEGDAPGSRAKAETNIGAIVGKYRITEVLGFGGMGTVYGALHTELGKRVALKVLASAFSGHPEAAARFKREAKAASAIESEHIAQVFDVGDDAAFGLYMVMELLKGEDLATALRSRRSLRPEDAAGVAWQVCLALERAHDAGIVHRDLKPANIFLTRADDGSIRVKVLDFGIAKLVRDAQSAKRASMRPPGGQEITQAGLAVGTPQYMSPEQTLAQELDRRTDIYSLGAVLWECVAGRSAYPELATVEMTMTKILTEEAPSLRTVVPDVPADLDSLVADMMARVVEARPQTAADVRRRLAEIYPDLGRTTLVLGALTRPMSSASRMDAPRTNPGARPETIRATTSDGDRDATTVKGARAKKKRASGLQAAIMAFVVVAAGSIVAVRTLAPASTGTPASGASSSAAIEDTIDPMELVRASQRALSRGDKTRARDLATKATARAPTSSDAWLALAAADEALGDSTSARAAYASCVTNAKDDRVDACRARIAH